MISLAVVICTLDRKASCLRTLSSLREQVAGDFTVCVVDNGGTDGTVAAVEALIPDFPVPLSVTVETTPGLSAARNHGARMCLDRADCDEDELILVFLDDDVVVVPDLVGAYRRATEDPTVAAAGGRIIPRIPDEMDAVLRPFLEAPYGGPGANFDLGDDPCELEGCRDKPAPFGGNMAIRCTHLRALGGFRETLGWGSAGDLPSEESELFQRMLQGGARIVYVPEAEVLHCIQDEKLTRENFLAWYRKQGCAASLMLRNKRGFLGRIASMVELQFQVLRYGRRMQTAESETARFKAECKRVRALGKLKALRGAGPNFGSSLPQPCE